MTLLEMIQALKTNNVNVSVRDGESDAEIIAFKAAGILGVESEVSARTVKRWTIDGSTAISVVLESL